MAENINSLEDQFNNPETYPSLKDRSEEGIAKFIEKAELGTSQFDAFAFYADRRTNEIDLELNFPTPDSVFVDERGNKISRRQAEFGVELTKSQIAMDINRSPGYLD